MDKEKVYYIIREDVLPEAVKKTLAMKKALEDDSKLSILEASKIDNFESSSKAFFIANVFFTASGNTSSLII